MTAPDALNDTDLEQVSWDLTDLLDGAGGDGDARAAVDALLDEAKRRADAFAAAHAGKVAALDGPGLVAAMHELGELEEIAGRAAMYAHLSFSVDTADPARGALLQRVQEQGTALETALLFFELEWAGEGRAVRPRAAVLGAGGAGAGRRKGGGGAGRRRARLRPPPPGHGAAL